MSEQTQNQFPMQVQLNLFQASPRLNLSATYEAIIKEVLPSDKDIRWSGDLAKPVEKPFSLDGQRFTSVIAPASVKIDGDHKSRFPGLREARVEYAIIALASRENLQPIPNRDPNMIPGVILRTSIYAIRKEIVDSINTREKKSLKVQDCPYNTRDIKEALEILKRTNYTITNADGQKDYEFNRIKDFYREGDKYTIELGTMIVSYIQSGDWQIADTESILATGSYYLIRLRSLLNTKFRYAAPGRSYSISLTALVEKMSFNESPQKRTTIQRIKKLLESMHEVEKVTVEPIKEGRKIVDAMFHIAPSASFIQTMLRNNTQRKKIENHSFDSEGNPLIEPSRSDFSSSSAYEKALQEYKVMKGKTLF
ncbi:MAG: hypothetical protein HWE20_03945 [Gammaproteobacteria bacterium]|nr:hypothetical protein [Gammaproteobacteria bacterium]